MEKTIGELVDALSIMNIRIWMLEDKCREECDLTKIGEAKLKINKCNQIRNELIQAIDKFHGKDTGQGDLKKYGK